MFENFRNKCIETYELDPAHFLLPAGLAWKACLKKNGGRTRIINQYWYTTIDRKMSQKWNCHAIHWYVKTNNKYMKNYKESSYLMYWDAVNL